MPKFGTTSTPWPGLQTAADVVEELLADAARADHDVQAGVDAPAQVVGHRGGVREVDDDVGGLQGGAVVADVHAGDELEVVGPLDGGAGLGAHAPRGTQHARP